MSWRATAERELVLCSACLFEEPTQPRADSLVRQVAAAREAGFAGISLWSMHEAAARQGGASADEVRESVLGSGLGVPLVEAVLPWQGTEADAARDAEASLSIAEAYGARFVAAVTMDPALPPVDVAVGRLRTLCERAADRGLAVAVEFLPWSGIPTLAALWQLVQEVDVANLGIVIDGWHWRRQPGGPDLELLQRIPPERIAVLQLSDAAPVPDGDPMGECMVARALPGEGASDLASLVAALDAMGATPLVAPEIFNRALAARGPLAMARAIHEASTRVLRGA